MTGHNMVRDSKSDHISVCICTYKRPEMLTRALDGVASQVTASAFSFEVVVVDNDSQRSAEDTVRLFQSSNELRIIYDCEPEQNIALARNRAIRNAMGNLIAFIDDDEYTVKDWLAWLYHTMKEYNADGALGPVLPFFPPGAPKWLKDGRFCERKRLSTGSLISTRDMRTGNILFHRHIFEKGDMWFDPVRGRTGGEDGEFLGRQMKKGRRFVWCDEALVFETVPEERWHASFYRKKYFRIGILAGERHRRAQSISLVTKACALLLGYSFLLPFSFLMRK
ncbi:MAG: glycosyltransferase family 2 protein, partial [Desulfobacterales bacterium]|nr:glycosyltransferase family 2 protein [Desulfobacterales bacterium]